MLFKLREVVSPPAIGANKEESRSYPQAPPLGSYAPWRNAVSTTPDIGLVNIFIILFRIDHASNLLRKDQHRSSTIYTSFCACKNCYNVIVEKIACKIRRRISPR